MIYYFDYVLNDKLAHHTCYTLKEAEVFFDIIVSAGSTSIRVITKRKKGKNDKIGT